MKEICLKHNCPNLTNAQLLKYINERTKDFIPHTKLNYKMYWVLKELQDFPKCEYCGHTIEPKMSFRVSVDPNTLEVSSTLAKRCNNMKCAQLNPNTRETAKKHFQEKFGVDNPYQAKEVIEKIKKTNKMRYGVEWASQSNQIKEKQKQSCLEKYGVDNCWKLPKVKQHCADPNSQAKRMASLKKYNQQHHGVDWYVQSDEFKEKTKTTNGTSKEEKEIVDWLHTFLANDEIEVGTFKIIAPKQLDVYLPKHKIAIEFNGIFYHSIEHGIDEKYHISKTIACEKLGIKLIHIWEDEWLAQKDKIKQFIFEMINGIFEFEKHFVERDGLCEIDRSKLNKCCIDENTYEIIEEQSPKCILRSKHEKDKYKVYDCGIIVLKRK